MNSILQCKLPHSISPTTTPLPLPHHQTPDFPRQETACCAPQIIYLVHEPCPTAYRPLLRDTLTPSLEHPYDASCHLQDGSCHDRPSPRRDNELPNTASEQIPALSPSRRRRCCPSCFGYRSHWLDGMLARLSVVAETKKRKIPGTSSDKSQPARECARRCISEYLLTHQPT